MTSSASLNALEESPRLVAAGKRPTVAAIEAATSKLRAALASIAVADAASPLGGKPPQDLEFRGEMIRSRSSNAGERFVDVLARTASDGLEAEGESAATDHQKLAATGMGYGAIFVEIGVDAGYIACAALSLPGGSSIRCWPGANISAVSSAAWLFMSKR